MVSTATTSAASRLPTSPEAPTPTSTPLTLETLTVHLLTLRQLSPSEKSTLEATATRIATSTTAPAFQADMLRRVQRKADALSPSAPFKPGDVLGAREGREAYLSAFVEIVEQWVRDEETVGEV